MRLNTFWNCRKERNLCLKKKKNLIKDLVDCRGVKLFSMGLKDLIS